MKLESSRYYTGLTLVQFGPKVSVLRHKTMPLCTAVMQHIQKEVSKVQRRNFLEAISNFFDSLSNMFSSLTAASPMQDYRESSMANDRIRKYQSTHDPDYANYVVFHPPGTIDERSSEWAGKLTPGKPVVLKTPYGTEVFTREKPQKGLCSSSSRYESSNTGNNQGHRWFRWVLSTRKYYKFFVTLQGVWLI